MRPETKQLLKNIAIGLGVFSLVALLLYGVWHGTRLPAFTITQVIVTGGETISHDTIKSDVEQLLEGEYLGFVPRQFVWTYPESDILEAVAATDRVKDPTVLRDGTQLTISFAEFESVALWCNSRVSDQCVFLDANGYGFASAPQLRGGAFTRFVRSGQPAQMREVFADATDFAQLRALVDLLESASWAVAVVEVDQVNDVFIYLAGGAELKTSLMLTPQETFDNLQATLSAPEYQHFTDGNFEYIDLRFGNKIFVKEFPDVVEIQATSTDPIKNATSSEGATEG